MKQSLYNFSVMNNDDEEVPLSRYKGRVLLILNTNSDDIYHTEFKTLEYLYKKYQPFGLEILAFPSNKFSEGMILEDYDLKLDYKRKYDIQFDVMKKIQLDKNRTHPLFKFLTESRNRMFKNEIKRAFTMFLISREGRIVKRFNSEKTVEEIEKFIQKYIEG
ncbi:redoxin domain-containing protein [Phocicoccus pinnipedialis]|uniref:Glutathione peroxidase homolog BsaA n=1 Tax=Phocicoccus pinnipedialis TaxID=110845 RepID=A0A6V7RGB4_9BACL|nr:redoxin domain-containing protein [Jeotgalicoccus pinnipedialis]MBP1939148.1 glutathione peroxidase [Jeotgalicoccus pinnipedialis]CAD2076582.1 Glutathione peroxidase BsaA [Jeotgalicoccus pinnipedialis]